MSTDPSTHEDAAAVLRDARSRGIQLWAEGGKLRFRAPEGALDAPLKKRLQASKAGLLELLAAPAPTTEDTTSGPAPAWAPAPAAAAEPFPLTDIQQAYFIGRRRELELGNLSPCLYLEISTPTLDPTRLGAAWQALRQRHPMLRARLLEDGQWQVPAADDPPPPGETSRRHALPIIDLQDAPPTLQLEAAEALRRRLGEEGPADGDLATLMISRLTPTDDRVHLCLSLLICDALSLRLLLREATWLYQLLDGDPRNAPADVLQRLGLEPLELTFRDYVLALRRGTSATAPSSARRRALEYWDRRLLTLPPAPRLPLARSPAAVIAPRLRRLQAILPAPLWQRIRDRARAAGATPTAVVAAAYARLLATWARYPRFLLTVLFFDRRPVHSQVEQVLGNFSSTLLLEVEIEPGEAFEATVQRLQERLWSDLEHAEVTGIEVLRRRRARLGSSNAGAATGVAPVAFASTLGLEVAPATPAPESALPPGDEEAAAAETVEPLDLRVLDSRVQTPQVWLDHQVTERDGALFVSWDVLVELFPEGLAVAAFDVYYRLLASLADASIPWSAPCTVPLPEEDQDYLDDIESLPPAADPDALAARLREAVSAESAEMAAASFLPAAAPAVAQPLPQSLTEELAAIRARVVDGAGQRRPFHAPGELLLGRPGGAWLATGLEARRGVTGALEVLGPLPEPLPAAVEASAAEPAGAALAAPSAGASTVTEAPVGETEERLAALWREVLDLPTMGRHEAFFDLGGHSLAAVRLLGQVRQAFGVSLPLATLFDGGTVAGLAQAVEAGRAVTADAEAGTADAAAADADGVERGEDPLVPLRRQGSEPPLLWMHPIGGGVLCYTALANALGGLRPQQPLWGMETPAGAAPTLEARATDYLELLRRRGFGAPWRLAGWSLGGVLAWEMACQLEAAGEAVETLLMIDPGAPAAAPQPELTSSELARRFLADLASLSGLPAPALELAADDPWTAVRQRAHQAAAAAELPGADDETTFLTLLERFRANARALAAYVPPARSGGPATVLVAADGGDAVGHDGWRRLATAATLGTTPGNHYTLVQAPAVASLAHALASALPDAS